MNDLDLICFFSFTDLYFSSLEDEDEFILFLLLFFLILLFLELIIIFDFLLAFWVWYLKLRQL